MQCHRYFLSGSHDSTVTVWDFDTLMPVKNHYNYDSAINDASFSHDSQYLALGGDEYTIKINHTITGGAVTLLIAFWVHSAAWHSTNHNLCSWNMAVFAKLIEMLQIMLLMDVNSLLLPLCEASSPSVHYIILTSARPYRKCMLMILIPNMTNMAHNQLVPYWDWYCTHCQRLCCIALNHPDDPSSNSRPVVW